MATIDIKVDFRSAQPIYLQIVEQVQQLIADGQLKPGDQLPTVRQLATDLRVNFNTIARAYRILDEVGLISTQLGRGTYVWDNPSEATRSRLNNRYLEQQMEHFIKGLLQKGYTFLEIRAMFEQIIKSEVSENHEES